MPLKQPNLPIDVIMPEIAGSGHSYPVGNVFDIKKDVQLRKSTINIITPGNFFIYIYEWKDGVGYTGSPLFVDEKNYATSGNYQIDFKGLLLTAGKKYWIGRLDVNNPASVMRPIGAADTKPRERYTLLGGTRVDDKVISFPTTYYYFFGLEFETVAAKPAKQYPKNLVSLIPDDWAQGVRQQNQSIQASAYRITWNGPTINITPGSTVRMEFLTSYKAGLFIFDANDVCLYDSGWKYGAFSVVVPAGGVKASLNFGMANDGAIDTNRITQTSLSLFTVGELGAKPATMYGKKNLLPMRAQWTKRPGTTYTRFVGSRITWDANADYSGVQLYINDLDYAGKRITFGGERHPDTTIIFFYKKQDGTGSYIGLGKNEPFRTLDVPVGANELRFYVQNDTGKRGEFWSDKLFINYGDDSTYTPYEPMHKLQKTFVGNLFNPAAVLANYFIWDNTGALNQSGLGTAVTDYMEFIEGKTYVYDGALYIASQLMRIAYFDKNKQFIGGSNSYEVSREIVAPKNARFIRCSVHPTDFWRFRFYCKEDNAKNGVVGLPKAATQDTPFWTTKATKEAIQGYVYGVNQPVLDKGGIRVSEEMKESHMTKKIGVLDNVSGSLEFTFIPDKDQADYKSGNLNRTYFSTMSGQNFRIWSWGGGSDHVFNFDYRDSTNRIFLDYSSSTIKLEKNIPITFKIEWSPTQFKLYINGDLVNTKNISIVGNVFNTQVLTSPLFIGNNTTESTPMSGIYKNITMKDRNGKVTLSF